MNLGLAGRRTSHADQRPGVPDTLEPAHLPGAFDTSSTTGGDAAGEDSFFDKSQLWREQAKLLVGENSTSHEPL